MHLTFDPEKLVMTNFTTFKFHILFLCQYASVATFNLSKLFFPSTCIDNVTLTWGFLMTDAGFEIITLVAAICWKDLSLLGTACL